MLNNFEGRFSPKPDQMLTPPSGNPRPESTWYKHGDHWDATRYVTHDGGWTWLPVSAVNLPTEQAAWDWIANA